MRDTWKGGRQSDQLPLSPPEDPEFMNPHSSGTRGQALNRCGPVFPSIQRVSEGISRISFCQSLLSFSCWVTRGRRKSPVYPPAAEPTPGTGSGPIPGHFATPGRLPGHGYSCRAFIVSSGSEVICFPNFLEYRSMKSVGSGAISRDRQILTLIQRYG